MQTIHTVREHHNYDSPLITFSFSQAVYRGEYMHNIKGKIIPTDKTVDLERAYHANKIQSEVSIKLLGPQSFWYSKSKFFRS